MANMDLLSYERDSRWQPHLSWTYPDWTLQQRMETQAARREQAWQRIADKLAPMLSNLGRSGGGGVGVNYNQEIGPTFNQWSFGQSDYILSDEPTSSISGAEPENDYLERAYEKAPLLTGVGGYHIPPPHSVSNSDSNLDSDNNNRHNHHHHHQHHNHNHNRLRYGDSLKTQSPVATSSSPSPLSSQASRHQKYGGTNRQNNNHNYNTCNSSKNHRTLKLSAQAKVAQASRQQQKTSYQPIAAAVPDYQQQSRTQIIDIHQVDNLQQSEDLRHQQSMKRAQRRCWTVSGILVLLILLLFTIVGLMATGMIEYKTFSRIQI